jgi:hypothetical protein
MLTLTLGTLLLMTPPCVPMTVQLTTIALEPLEEQLPKTAVFFLPKSSALSPIAADIVAKAARGAGSGTIVVLQANSDNAAGETPETAADRADIVRRELVRNGVPASAIRITHASAFRAGIESRCVILSVIPAPSNSPRVATIPAGSRL